MIKKFTTILCLIIVLTLILSACNPAAVEQIATEEVVLTEEAVEEVVQVTEENIETEVVEVEETEQPEMEEEVEETEIPEPTPTSAPGVEAGDTERVVMVGDLERSYLLHVPKGFNSKQKIGIIFVFHHYGQNPGDVKDMTGFNDVVDRAKLSKALVVYPTGEGASWNNGEGFGYAVENDIDDVAFIEEIISDLESIINIDPKQIFAAGIYQGGMLSYRLACDLSDTFAAIASVSGAMQYSTCDPTQAVSVIHIHDLNDPSSPYDGGNIDGVSYYFLPVEDGIETWVTSNGCNNTDVQEDATNTTIHTTYSECEAETAVELYAIDGGWDSHWPDTTSMTIWTFFETHPKP